MNRVIGLVALSLLVLLPPPATLALISFESNVRGAVGSAGIVKEGGDCDGRQLGISCDLGSEFLVDSEVSRRILASSGSNYVSYGALSANRVPCSKAGRSYYNCRGSGAANPYSRGCSKISKCQRDTS